MEPGMTETEAFFANISPKTLEKVCQNAEKSLNESSSQDSFILSPIVGYDFSNISDDEASKLNSSSEADSEIDEFLAQMNAKLSLMIGKEIVPGPNTPRSEMRKRLRKRKFKMLKQTMLSATQNTNKRLKSTEQPKKNTTKPKRLFHHLTPDAKENRNKETHKRNVDIFDAEKPQTSKKCQSLNLLMGDKSMFFGNKQFHGFNNDEALKKSEAKEIENACADLIADVITKEEVPEVFIGFRTAAGNDVVVSDEALKKAKSLFSEIDAEMKSTESDGLSPKLFHKAVVGTKNLKINTNSTTIDNKNSNCSKDINPGSSNNFNEDNPEAFVGFRTGGGKDVAVSTEALEKAKSLFCDIDAQMTADDKIIKEVNGGSKFHNKIPSAANSKPIQRFRAPSLRNNKPLSTKVICKNNPQFTNPLKSSKPNPISPNKNTEAETFTGFRTAAGKGVIISEEAIKKAKNLFSDIDVEMNVDIPVPASSIPGSSVSVQLQQEKSEPFVGFQTAGGKSVVISEEALKRAKLLFTEIDAEDENTNDLKSVAVRKEKIVQPTPNCFKASKNTKFVAPSFVNSKPKPSGFQTASGKTVEISEESLKKVKGLFSDKDNQHQGNLDAINTEEDEETTEEQQPKSCQNIYTLPNPNFKSGEMAQEVLDCIQAFLDDEEVQEGDS